MKHEQQPLSAGVSLFCGVRWPKAKQPRRATILEFMDKAIPFGDLEAIVRPHFNSDRRKTGRPGVSLKMLVRCYAIQKLWNLSDDGLEAMLLDSHAAAKFVGTDPWQPRPPSASRIRDFRHLLDNTLAVFDVDRVINEAFSEAGVQVRSGQIQEPVFRRINA